MSVSIEGDLAEGVTALQATIKGELQKDRQGAFDGAPYSSLETDAARLLAASVNATQALIDAARDDLGEVLYYMLCFWSRMQLPPL
jgi:hypothetical protein